MLQCLLWCTVVGFGLAIPDGDANISRAFADFVKKYAKEYENPEERALRRAIFAENLAFIVSENSLNRGYKLAINKFSDLSTGEFAATHLTKRLRTNFSATESILGTHLGTHLYTGHELPSSVDWTQKGAVTPVKDQGHCGSCYAFSSTGALEGAWQIATGDLVSLSEQQLVDCARYRWGNNGCEGGLQKFAFNYVEVNAMCTEAEYNYTGKNSLFTFCKAASCSKPGLPSNVLAGYKLVDSNETALMSAIAQQPVAVSIEADQDIFKHYSSGILQGKGCGDELDHAVLAVGYGIDNGVKYWKVKNSWAEDWGEAGYVRITRSTTDECGILDGPPLYPVFRNSTRSEDLIVV